MATTKHTKRCTICKTLFRSERSDAKTCSDKCRMALSRRTRKEAAEAWPVWTFNFQPPRYVRKTLPLRITRRPDDGTFWVHRGDLCKIALSEPDAPKELFYPINSIKVPRKLLANLYKTTKKPAAKRGGYGWLVGGPVGMVSLDRVRKFLDLQRKYERKDPRVKDGTVAALAAWLVQEVLPTFPEIMARQGEEERCRESEAAANEGFHNSMVDRL